MENKMEIAKKEHEEIRERRKALGYTQKEAAEKLGMALRHYQRFESGERKLSNARGFVYLKVCKFLGFDIFHFVDIDIAEDESERTDYKK